jgi:uncharacterized CHY-type Zn-finger protein
MKFPFLSKSGQPPQTNMKCLNETVYCTHTHHQTFKRFREVHDDLEDHPRRGWPLAAQKQATIAGVCEIATRDHQMALKLMEEKMSYSS